MIRSKNIFIGFVIAIAGLIACNNENTKTDNTKPDMMHADSSMGANQPMKSDTSSIREAVQNSETSYPAGEIISGYLQMKNALAKDNGNEAAGAGTALETAFKNFDKTTLTTSQKKVVEEAIDDAKEHAEHIGKNAGNISHQREHFEIMSKDITDIIKSLGNGGQTLYYDFCPMYNDGKGAYWISETKTISNPYLGKKMTTCGTMKEEFK